METEGTILIFSFWTYFSKTLETAETLVANHWIVWNHVNVELEILGNIGNKPLDCLEPCQCRIRNTGKHWKQREAIF